MNHLDVFAAYLSAIEVPLHRARTEEVLRWVGGHFPGLAPRVAWNQPMFTDHGTFIIGFSVSAKHLAVSPERAGMERFASEIVEAGYTHGKMLFRIRWDDAVNYGLLERMILYNREDKADCKTFWRKG